MGLREKIRENIRCHAYTPHIRNMILYIIVHMEASMSEQKINYPPDLKERIAKVLSEILSDKYDCKITLRFMPKEENEPKDK